MSTPASGARMPGPGEPAPEFTLATPDGAEIALADHRGRRRVILWFSKGLF